MIRKFRIITYIFIYYDWRFEGPKVLLINKCKDTMPHLFVASGTSLGLSIPLLASTTQSFQLLLGLALLLVFSSNLISSESLPYDLCKTVPSCPSCSSPQSLPIIRPHSITFITAFSITLFFHYLSPSTRI